MNGEPLRQENVRRRVLPYTDAKGHCDQDADPCTEQEQAKRGSTAHAP